MLMWKLASVVPDVHLGVIKNIFKRTERDTEIGVIKMADDDGNDVYDYELVNTKADECKGEVF